jgi:hypothetical protein
LKRWMELLHVSGNNYVLDVCHIPKGYNIGRRAMVVVSYRGSPGSIPDLSMWDLWSSKWHWDGVFSEYSKTCEVGHPNDHLSQFGHTFTEPANSYNIIHGHYSVTWPLVYIKSWPHFRVYCYALCVSSTSICWLT